MVQGPDGPPTLVLAPGLPFRQALNARLAGIAWISRLCGVPSKSGWIFLRILWPPDRDFSLCLIGGFVQRIVAVEDFSQDLARTPLRASPANRTAATIGHYLTSMNTMKLSGKIAVVTGASKGIGASIAKHLAAEGACVVVNFASSKSGADKVVADIIGSGGTAIAVQGDVAKKADIERLFAETRQAFGRLDILVNNAGIYEFAPLENVTEELFHRQFNLNVLGLILTTQEAAKLFGPEGGSVINTSSVVSTWGTPGGAVYSATKAAVDAVTRCLAKELAPRRIRVNSVNPGMVETEGTHSAGITGSDFRKQTEAATPLGRICRPEDIAPAVVFLASADSAMITGESLFITGGFR